MAYGTFEEFLEYRNTKLSKAEGGKSGYHAFDNATAKLIYTAHPTSLEELGKVKGFPPNGERIKKYGTGIIAFFNGSNLFASRKKKK